jgi:hypothetical protein
MGLAVTSLVGLGIGLPLFAAEVQFWKARG